MRPGAVRKAIVLFYLGILGFAWLQLLWFLGLPAPGGLVLTPSASPYIPPLSLVITAPANTCEGWSIKAFQASFSACL
jgi:hypothetical protein